MRKSPPHKFSAGKARILAPFVACCLLLGVPSIAHQENWTPAYSDDQLDIINNALGKWKQDTKFPAVKDIFGDHCYQPDWDAAKPDATPWDLVPDSFKNEREARKAGCQCDYLKGMEKKTCLLKFAMYQGVWIFVYDQEPPANLLGPVSLHRQPGTSSHPFPWWTFLEPASQSLF